MKVYTKYTIGNQVWLISDNKAIAQKVTGVYISLNSDSQEPVITYTIQYGDVKYPESKLFPSKEELLKSL